MSWLVIFGLSCAYLALGVLITGGLGRVSDASSAYWEGPEPVLVILFWPLVTAALLIFLTAFLLVEAARAIGRKK